MLTLYLGNSAKAIEYSQQHLAIDGAIKDRKREGLTLGYLGEAYRFLGNYTKAIEYSQQQLAIARSIQDPRAAGLALNNLGLAFLRPTFRRS